ncbi:IS110 family transposase [Bradyrhizobium sp. sBnM-33]|uniref:IS110 family transposase n=1 Tax=Bradyrhizobium sp. sBnM-33 TaxID=2831780 RepID=UPI0020BF658C|nr:IS110 family transposase [Bradyrhizobium sp. sBnM-33]WOH52332.1 transposase [Bradyrhizobium sp. sBnM-33]
MRYRCPLGRFLPRLGPLVRSSGLFSWSPLWRRSAIHSASRSRTRPIFCYRLYGHGRRGHCLRPRHVPLRSGVRCLARLGLTPRQNSTCGKERLGHIRKQGDAHLRHLLIIGARNVVRYPKARSRVGAAWIDALLE